MQLVFSFICLQTMEPSPTRVEEGKSPSIQKVPLDSVLISAAPDFLKPGSKAYRSPVHHDK